MDYSSMIQQMMQARQPQQMRPPTAGMLPPGMGMNAQRPQAPQPSMGGPMGMQQRPMQPMGQQQGGNPYDAMVRQHMQGQQRPMGGPPMGGQQRPQMPAMGGGMPPRR